MYFIHFSGVKDILNSSTALAFSWIVLQSFDLTKVFKSFHNHSMGLRSGDCAGALNYEYYVDYRIIIKTITRVMFTNPKNTVVF